MKVLISMIGVGNAKTREYEPLAVRVPWLPEAEANADERYHQAALVRSLKPDAFWLVGTEDANAAHADKLPHNEFITVPKCEAEPEFWRMFEGILAKIRGLPWDEGDSPHELHVDLTHGFRIQPMFLLAAVRYAVRLQPERLAIAGIYYSMLDAKAKSATILPVDPIVEMERVAEDVYALVAYAQPLPLAARLERLEQSRRRDASTEQRNSQVFRDMRCLATALREFAAVVGINCTPIAAEVVKRLCLFSDALEIHMDGDLRPVGIAMAQLAAELRRELPGDGAELWRWHGALARWCVKRNLLQQALTHAEELVVTRACEERQLDPLDRRDREPVGAALKTLMRSPQHRNDSARGAWAEVLAPWNQINSLRNAVNHAYTGQGAPGDAVKREGSIRKAIAMLVGVNDKIARLPAFALDASGQAAVGHD